MKAESKTEQPCDEIEIMEIGEDIQPCSGPTRPCRTKGSEPVKTTASWKTPPFKVFDKVYGLHRSLKDPWKEAQIEEIYDHFGKELVRLKFDEGSHTKRNRVVNANHIAYFDPIPWDNLTPVPVGWRVIARTRDANYFFAGIVAEPPKHINKQRYLIFFDDGYAAYCQRKNIRLVSISRSFAGHMWSAVHPDTQLFIKKYIRNYPNNPKATVREHSILSVEWNGLWWPGRVISVDCSLVRVKLISCGILLVVWKGSNRLIQIYKEQNPQIPHWIVTNEEYEGKIVRHQVPDKYTKSLLCYDPGHECDRSCGSTFTGKMKELRKVSPLAVPFYHGWKRDILLKEKGRLVYYETPCGKRLTSEDEVQTFITRTNCPIGIDTFSFSIVLNCWDEFEVVQRKPGHFYSEDISFGQEWVPISKINSVNTNQPPYIAYTNQRLPGKGVYINTQREFLVCCDCTDNCEDEQKCACLRLTFENDPEFQNPSQELSFFRGYQNRRLFGKYMSGIYECNSYCKCRKTCMNRVVQHGLKYRLEVFYTVSKGYAIRTLQDIPDGSFICVYTGELLTSQQANEDGNKFGDEYLANLDFVENAERCKPGYEETVVEPEPPRVTTVARRSSVGQKTSAGKKSIKSVQKRGKNGRKKPNSSNKENSVGSSQKKGKTGKRKRYFVGDDDTDGSDDEEEDTNDESNSKTRLLYGPNEDKDIYAIDAKCIGNVGRYFNHSCNPNIFAQDVFLDTHDIRYPWVAFFASRYIQCGSELTWDYNYTIGQVEGRNIPCNCGSLECRKRLL